MDTVLPLKQVQRKTPSKDLSSMATSLCFAERLTENGNLPNETVNMSTSGLAVGVAYTLSEPPSRVVVMVDEASLGAGAFER